MALILNDRVRETTAVTGTGSATLLGAVTGYQSFSVIGNGNTTYYTIADQGGPNWEVGLGTYSSGTLARTTVLSSSNSGSLVNFTAGTKDVFVTQPSEKAVYLDGSGNITPSSVGPLTVSSLTDSGLTSGRVTYATTGGLLTDSANMTFNGSTLTSLNSAYTGTLTGGTGVVNLGSGQFYKDASGNVGVGTASPVSASGYGALTVNGTTGSLVYLQNNATSAMQIATNSSGASITAIGASLPLYFSTNSTERMRIDSSGNVGIGTSSPTLKLDVQGNQRTYSTTATTTYNLFQNSLSNLAVGILNTGNGYIDVVNNYALQILTNDTERMRIDSSGNVGIGTSSPNAPLSIQSDSSTNSLSIFGRASDNISTQWFYQNDKTTLLASLQARTDYFEIAAQQTTIPIAFKTNGTERMRIDSSGNVGIGYTNPTSPLTINSGATGTAQDIIRLISAYSNPSGNKAILWSDGSANNLGRIAVQYSGGNAAMTFGSLYASGSNSNELMRLDSSGNLLVGTTTAIGKLTVAGLVSAQAIQAKGASAGAFSADAMFFQNEGANLFRSYTCGTNGSSYGQWQHYSATSAGTPLSVFTASNGSFAIAGALSKGSGSFRIDHPLPQLGKTHQLVHSFIEGPQADLIYRGRVTLVNGKAIVNIDEVATMTEGTFVVLCRDVQCFTTNESDWTPVRGSVSGNILTIESQDVTATSNISWMVIGERQDKHMMDTFWTDENGKVVVEPLKKPELPIAPLDTSEVPVE